MKRKFTFLLLFVFVIFISFYFLEGPALAQNSKKVREIKTVTLSAQDVAADSFFNGIPPAIVECEFGGNLAEVFPGNHKFKSSENAILIDGENRKLAVREIIVTTDGEKSTGSVDMYVEVDDVTNSQLIDLLVLKKTTRTNNAKVNLVLRKKTDEGETILKTNVKGEGENLNPAILFAKIRKIGSTRFNDKDYFLVSGEMKLRLTEELKGKNGSNTSDSTTLLDDRTGVMKCTFEKCPVVKTNLDKLNAAFGVNISESDVTGGE